MTQTRRTYDARGPGEVLRSFTTNLAVCSAQVNDALKPSRLDVLSQTEDQSSTDGIITAIYSGLYHERRKHRSEHDQSSIRETSAQAIKQLRRLRLSNTESL